MEPIKGFMMGDKLCLSVENLNEFYQLIELAQIQLQELNSTLTKLKTYEIEIAFSKGR